jgi:hypothetical protein
LLETAGSSSWFQFCNFNAIQTWGYIWFNVKPVWPMSYKMLIHIPNVCSSPLIIAPPFINHHTHIFSSNCYSFEDSRALPIINHHTHIFSSNCCSFEDSRALPIINHHTHIFSSNCCSFEDSRAPPSLAQVTRNTTTDIFIMSPQQFNQQIKQYMWVCLLQLQNKL